MSKRKSFLLVCGTTVIFVGIYAWLFGFQTIGALEVRYEYWKLPDVAKTPIALADLSISSTPHTKATYFGYGFELPWDDVDETKDKTIGSIHMSAFHSGNAFWFSTFPPKSFANEIMKAGNLDSQGFRRLFGDAAFESDYSFHKMMLQMAPSEITPFISRRQAVIGQTLLLIKGISMPRTDSGIFSIQTPDFQGFQFESPQNRPFRITAELFSDSGGVELVFLQKGGSDSPGISQAEINRVVQSVHKVPTQAMASNTGGQKR
jgi:hypothetical protein